MNDRMALVNEGFVLDDSGNLIATTYIDMRLEVERNPVPALVKGCKREHALEDGATILISKPTRFREYGEKLIQDVQEGSPKDESVTVREETAVEAAKRRSVADLNEAQDLLNSRFRMTRTVTYSGKDTESKSLSYGKEWWIFCTSIEPNEEEWEAWRATLPEEYDHVSKIGQPAKFAEALARMVTEQVGPQGKEGWMQNTTKGSETERTKHRLQWVIHGPVVYTDQVYGPVADESDGMKRLAASIFTKSTRYAAQREYRFAVLNEGATDETLLLQISGMLRDALKRTEVGLIRNPPTPTEWSEEDEAKAPSQENRSWIPTFQRATRTERLSERQETCSEIRAPDGEVKSSESERRESVTERVVTQEHQPDDEGFQASAGAERSGNSLGEEQPAPQHALGTGEQYQEQSDEETVQELALEEREWNDDHPGDSLTIPVVHLGTGRVYKSFDEALSDPAYPMGPVKETWRERACSPEEIAEANRAVDTLEWKVPYIKEEFRQDAASACWYAMLCIRNVYARLSDIVDSVWIERERFVVIRLKESDDLKASGRIVIAPTGSYAYCLQLPSKEVSGHGGEAWGSMFFPLGNQVDRFREFGWPEKPGSSGSPSTSTQ